MARVLATRSRAAVEISARCPSRATDTTSSTLRSNPVSTTVMGVSVPSVGLAGLVGAPHPLSTILGERLCPGSPLGPRVQDQRGQRRLFEVEFLRQIAQCRDGLPNRGTTVGSSVGGRIQSLPAQEP